MISLKAFVAAIHGAVLEASDALVEKNVGLIEQFFEGAGASAELQSALNRVLNATSRLTDPGYTPRKGDFSDLLMAMQAALKTLPPEEQNVRNLLLAAARESSAVANDDVRDPSTSSHFATALQAIQRLHDLLYQPSDPGEAKMPVTGALRPRAVTVEFPSLNADGTVSVVDVEVPLITLIPLSLSQIKKAKLKTAFELHVEGDELQIGFPGARKKKDDGDVTISTGRLEITIGLHEASEGLKTIVDAYDQTLRAQIPH